VAPAYVSGIEDRSESDAHVYTQDRELVARMLAGDERAFDTFFASYARRLAAFAARRADLPPATVEDLVQNTLIKAIRNLASFRGEAALFTWLCEICRNEIVNVIRSSARRPAHDSLDEISRGDESPPEFRAPACDEPLQVLELDSRRNAIVATMNGLPERYALALEWKYGDGLSVEEIARLLGLTTIAAQSLLARARLAFKTSWPEELAP
jgi:RNA polymerase sigma-70 factor (ECF subfamily)